MLAHWPIRYKLSLCVALLCGIVSILSFSSFRGVYAYRQLARAISQRAAELPLSAELTRSVHELRLTIQPDPEVGNLQSAIDQAPYQNRELFRARLRAVRGALDRYQGQLSGARWGGSVIGENVQEWQTVREIRHVLARIDRLAADDPAWVLGTVPLAALARELDDLEIRAAELPSHLQVRMQDFVDRVRVQYRTWIVLTWLTSLLAGVLLWQLVRMFNAWVVKPFGILIRGSRRVAAGDFDHRIVLQSRDEVAELAGAMNAMTSQFQRIRDDLDEQVKLRTREVIRGEQLASVGFLAAGVAHEINNPLASIAWCAESLESRLHDIILEDDAKSDEEHNTEITVLRRYLRRIQDEAFRCKGITEQLLDFSRLGHRRRQRTDLGELIQGVIDMVRHLGKYRDKRIELDAPAGIVATVNAQEFKQVVLNLLTNGLDSLDAGGLVRIALRRRENQAEMLVVDEGCGMSPETMEHLFEPFFTRRRDGQGTGLGLSITYRIITDHGGEITAASDGLQRGSTFRVTIPLVEQQTHDEEKDQRAA